MSWWIVLVTAIVLGVVFLFKYVEKGVPEAVGALEIPILGLLRQGYDGGRLTITIRDREERLLFRKYIRAPDDYGIRLMVSDEEIAPEHFQTVAQFLKWRTSNCEVIQSPITDERQSLTLQVDFGTDSANATRVVIDLLEKVYGLSREDSVLAKLDNAAYHLVDGGEKAEEPPSH